MIFKRRRSLLHVPPVRVQDLYVGEKLRVTYRVIAPQDDEEAGARGGRGARRRGVTPAVGCPRPTSVACAGRAGSTPSGSAHAWGRPPRERFRFPEQGFHGRRQRRIRRENWSPRGPFEPPDLFHSKFVGDSSVVAANVSQVLKRATGKFYIAMETTEMGSFTSGAKKVIREVPLAAGIAIFGASRQMQLVVRSSTRFT